MKLKLAVIADDFTGALDTGIKFSEGGVRTKVMLSPQFSFSEIEDDVKVLVVDTETRHLKPENAYATVYSLVKRCLDNGVELLYKKTDSVLRGCIGSELSAVVDATGRSVEFVPALPNGSRTTKNGIQYVDKIPVAESVFGADPFEPVANSYIPDIIREETDKETIVVAKGETVPETDSPGIVIYDASTDEDIKHIADTLKERGRLKIMAGCSGFASCLQEMLDLPKGTPKKPRRTRNLFIECGSINTITEKQLLYAQKKGFNRIILSDPQKLKSDYFSSAEGASFLMWLEEECKKDAPVILDVFTEGGTAGTANYGESIGMKKEDLRCGIAKRMGEFGEKWLGFNLDDTIVITGGDTAYAFLIQIKCTEIEPVYEIVSGAVLFNIKAGNRRLQVISKSGGLGDEDIFVNIASKTTWFHVV